MNNMRQPITYTLDVNVEICQLIVEEIQDKNLTLNYNIGGFTPYYLAQAYDHKEIVAYMKSKLM